MNELFQKKHAADLYVMLGCVAARELEADGVLCRLRAVTLTHPGGADELYLELWRAGDEADPWTLQKRVKVKTGNTNTISELGWGEGFVAFWSDRDSEARGTRWCVRATVDQLEDRAVRE